MMGKSYDNQDQTTIHSKAAIAISLVSLPWLLGAVIALAFAAPRSHVYAWLCDGAICMATQGPVCPAGPSSGELVEAVRQ